MIALQLTLLALAAATYAAPSPVPSAAVDSMPHAATASSFTLNQEEDITSATQFEISKTTSPTTTETLKQTADIDTGEYSPHKLSLEENDEQVPEEELGQGEDMEGAETIVFRPLFRYRDGSIRRRVRETNGKRLPKEVMVEKEDKEVSDSDLEQGEDMEVAETIVFRPLFGYGRSTRRRVRDVNQKLSPNDKVLEEENREVSDDKVDENEDMEVAETIVFRPLFGYGGSTRRRVRDVNQKLSQIDKVLEEENKDVSDDKVDENEDMEVAETIVFRPLFGYRGSSSRRRVRDTRNVHSHSQVSLIQNDETPVTGLGEAEDLEGAETIVFRPLFRYHEGASTRRRVRESNRGRDIVYRRTYAARFPYDRYRSSPKRRNAYFTKNMILV